MKYAIIRTGGKQYQVSEAEELLVEKINSKEGVSVEFDSVLLLVDGEKVAIGQPTIKGARVKAKIVGQVKGPKIRVAKFKAKSRYRRVRGHRQRLTRIKIEKIYG